MKREGNKLGQVTIFIIIAVILVAAVALFFVFKDDLGVGEESISPEAVPIKNYVDECLKETLEKGSYSLALKGGYKDIPKESLGGEAYYIYSGKDYFPSKEKIEEELQRYVEANFFRCTEYSKDFPNYELEEGNFEPDVRIDYKEIILKVDYPLRVEKENSSFLVKNFEISIPSRMGEFHDDLKEFFYSNYGDGGLCLNCFSNKVDMEGVGSEIDLTVENTTLFRVFELNNSSTKKTKLDWRFAIES